MAGLPILAVVSAARPFLEPLLPEGIEVRWIDGAGDALQKVTGAEIGWLDLFPGDGMGAMIAAATGMRWLNTWRAGIDALPVELFKARGIALTNGSGVHDVAISEYAIAGMFALAKHLPDVVRAHDRQEWARPIPSVNLAGSHVLVIGYGSIGRRIGAMLAALGATVTGVRRSARDGAIGADEWRPRLGAFDWVVLAAPGTADTRHMIGTAEFAAMKPGARLVNVARGSLVDQPALIEALATGKLAGAFLDTVDPEPLPAADPLWRAPNALITMHLSGRAQTGQWERAAPLFAANLQRWIAGEPLKNRVDFALGY
ncbi:D-2-hydroxyacid dehydrogenase [Sphingomonas sanxanigenens]|uniref:D-isomer specific 2-hydroxyacid dehydrogenase NAD-binding domain-containing protein n=1 Tax=Sphingomonas sanxanigenens DSM 19645 = NX02 TaxID=1123269 RepID=W0A9E4_9SPHN|nr:D-2-hydroxyacid dehydrogenase [Sphingomonas sanxanigenens]AHE54524.1 hypothetical protein NX02_14185 [Sphingomonas sanxanigenens DSM 19645 = NX02]